MFRIGDFSKFSRVSIKMLRHYDEIGLLKPVHVDPFTSYRYYSVDQLPRLNRIIALKDLGFTLEQITRLLDEGLSAEQIKGMLKLKRAEIEQQLQAEEQRLAQVEARLRQIEAEDQFPVYDVIVREVEPQLVASSRLRVRFEEDSIGAAFETLEAYVARYKARALAPPLTVYHDTEYQEQGLEVEVAVPANPGLPGNEQIRVYELPGAELMAYTVHQGSYATLHRAFNALLNWIETNGYQVAGPLREVYLRFGADNQGYELPGAYLAEEAAAFMTELQLPVKKVLSGTTASKEIEPHGDRGADMLKIFSSMPLR